MRALALDIGGTKIATALVDGETLSDRQQFATPQSDAQNAMADCLAKVVQHYQGQFDYIAVASTGIIFKGILTALNPKNLGGLAQFPLKQALANHTDKPIGLLNDVQAAAFAEYQTFGQNDIENFLFITVSTGVGGGLILQKQLQTKPRGVAGHIGHTLADPNGPQCGCGRVGCVEAIASGRAIEAATQSWETPLSPKDVFARFRDKTCAKSTALVQRSADTISHLIADMVIGLDIQHTVLGGSVGLAEGYLPLVQKSLEKLPHFYHCPITAAHHRHDAGLLGAAWWVKHCLTHNISLD